MKKICLLALPLLLASPALAADTPPNDAEIAAIVVAANQVDIDAGKYAEAKAPDLEVKGFASKMVTDHSSVNKSAVELVTKLNVTPQENDTSRALTEGGQKNIAKLEGLSGKEMEKAYIDHEVAYHEQVLDTVDKTLIPNASNAELKALLVKVRPAYAEHLAHAKRLQSTFNG